MSTRLSDYDYELPHELIAQRPTDARDGARLMTLDRSTGAVAHKTIRDLPDLLQPGDVLVFNASKVIPARIHGQRTTGARVEVLLLRPTTDATVWEALAKPGRRLAAGEALQMPERRSWTFLGWDAGVARVDTHLAPSELHAYLDRVGETPFPPYITPDETLRDRYQTVYAKDSGSVAAPTAGLHFTPELLAALDQRGVERVELFLHVGLGTFQPVTVDDVSHHPMHAEAYELPTAAAAAINAARAEGRRIIAVGTTSARVLETTAKEDDLGTRVIAGAGETRIFLRPGVPLRIIDGLLTNFHLPKSTLLMLVSALAGREHILAAYQQAVRERYRFFSFGDAMLIS